MPASLVLNASARKQMIVKDTPEGVWVTCITTLKDEKLYEELYSDRKDTDFKRKWWITRREATGPRTHKYATHREKTKPVGCQVIL